MRLIEALIQRINPFACGMTRMDYEVTDVAPADWHQDPDLDTQQRAAQRASTSRWTYIPDGDMYVPYSQRDHGEFTHWLNQSDPIPDLPEHKGMIAVHDHNGTQNIGVWRFSWKRKPKG